MGEHGEAAGKETNPDKRRIRWELRDVFIANAAEVSKADLTE